jgi:hypothetical protein
MTKPKTVPTPKVASKKKPVNPPIKKKVPKPKVKYVPPNYKIKCSFCGDRPIRSKNLITAPPPSKAVICDDCVIKCLRLLSEIDPQCLQYHLIRLAAMSKDDKQKPTKRKVKKEKVENA